MKLLRACLTVLAMGVGAASAAENPISPPSVEPRNAVAEQLIDELAAVNTPVAGADITPSGRAGGGSSGAIPGSSVSTGAKASPMRQLVQMGVAAVPSLLGHLTDARETKLVITTAGSSSGSPGVSIGPFYFSNEYDARYRNDPAREPAGVTILGKPINPASWEGIPSNSYTMRVGDLCYVILGQIVNRTFAASRYQGTGGAVVNSPVQRPALAAAARQDWTGLTAEQHRVSLVGDLTGPQRVSNQRRYAFEALRIYYPAAVGPALVEVLRQPVADWHDARLEVLRHALLAEADAVERAATLRAAEKSWSATALYQLAVQMRNLTSEASPTLVNGKLPADWEETESVSIRSGASEKVYRKLDRSGGGFRQVIVFPQPQWDRAAAVLRFIDEQGWLAVFKDREPIRLQDDLELLRAFGSTPDPVVDEAAVDLFRRLQALGGPDEPPTNEMNALAQICVQRLGSRALEELNKTLLAPWLPMATPQRARAPGAGEG